MAKKKAAAGYMSAPVKMPKLPDYVVAEMRYDSKIAYTSRGFTAPSEVEKDAASLNKVLDGFKVKRIGSHFDLKSTEIKPRSTDAPPSLKVKPSGDFIHAGFVQIIPKNAKDCAALAKRLNQKGSVWKAYVATTPEPAGLAYGASAKSRNFEPCQGYLHSAPNGIGAMAVWKSRKATGRGVRICDIEGNWNFAHEDLPKIQHIGGTLINDLGWRNHGTAVLGEMVSFLNEYGTAGIAYGATPLVHSFKIGGVSNPAAAIRNAAKKMKAGDVILIELQRIGGSRNKYLALQYWDDVFSAIMYATKLGVTVVEAAGNGDENFDRIEFRGTGLQKDAGAIVVGAGVPPTNYYDHFGRRPFAGGEPATRYTKMGNPRARMWFSNYGKIVNVQGWGWHVTTCGYGDAQGSKGEKNWYTHRFSGTSSASPIVTGAVAVIQSYAKRRLRRPLTPKEVRTLLIKTGTPQDAAERTHIGPLPNLEKALGLRLTLKGGKVLKKKRTIAKKKLIKKKR
jgi:hypothetical protein